MKNITTIAATILIFVFLILSIGLNVKQYLNAEKKENTIENLIENGGKSQIVKQYTKDSITHTVYNETIVNDARTEKELAIGKTYADSLQKALKISINKIDQVTKINAMLEAKLALKETAPTPDGKRILSHRDKNLKLDYYPDTDSVDLAMNIVLNEARYKKKKWILGKEERFVEVFPDDKRITINGLKSFAVKETPPKRLGIGFSAGYGLSVTKDGRLNQAPVFGIGLNYNIIEF